MTSAGRLDRMLASDSPLMERANTKGLQQAQQRGLLNSSMAAGSAQGAMIDRAQPFALQDSSNLIRNQQFNAGEANRFGLLKGQVIGDDYLSSQRYEQQLGLGEQKQGFTQGNMQMESDLQAQRDEQLFGYDLTMADKTAGIQATRDARLAELDAESSRLRARLDEARAENDLGRSKQLNQQLADIDTKQSKLNFEQDKESMVKEYGLRDTNAINEADRAMNEMFAASTGNAWGVTANNMTDLAGQASAEIQDVQMNPNITKEDKATMIDGILARRDTDLEFQQSISDSLKDTLLDTGAFQPGGFNSSSSTGTSNASAYAEDKLASLQTDSQTSAEWSGKTAADVQAAFAESGLTPLDHYIQFGADEGVSPGAGFNADFNARYNVPAYLQDKLAALQTNPSTSAEWSGKTTADVQAAFNESGLTPMEHYIQFGEDEGLRLRRR